MVEIEGKLIEIIFKNESNGYTVGVLETSEEEVTLVGYLPALREGEHLLVKGDWKIHPVYGHQLEVEEYRPLVPSSEEGMITYLSSGIVPGVGKKMAKRIVEHFGQEALEVIEFQTHRLTEVSGIGKAKAETIAEAFRDQRELREIILFLSQYGISPNYAVKIYKKYGDSTIATIQENPYRLAEDIVGIGFITADRIAKTMGIAANSKYRIYAGTKYILNTFHIEGHTYAPLQLLIERTKELLKVEESMIQEAVQSLALNQNIQIERQREEIVVYSMPYYYSETNVCKKLIELSRVKLDPLEINIEEELQSLQDEENISLAENQKEAIKQAIENGILVITGGPGTGKTTTINTLIKILEKLEMKITLGAPTGRASKRMTEATGKEAKTIHRLLELGFSDEEDTMMFQRDDNNPLEGDVIIIDEVSMVDILLMHSLMKAVALGTRLILVGDVDQLPSVGAGNVLKDIISSKIVKVVRLNEIFRQAGESMIIVNAHKINHGQYPVANVKDKDFYFITKQQKEEVAQTILELVKERLPKHYQYNPIKDIQVLAPMKKGEVGTLQLNKMIQHALNPPAIWKAEKEMKEKILRVGDKVMQIKNNYTLKWYSQNPEDEEDKGEGVFNGDIGFIQTIDQQQEELSVLFDEYRLVTYNFSQLEELELAYCVTIHKSQGSEFPVVVMPITWGPPMLLTRNLLYTAITRAKKLVVLVGTENYLRRMVDNNKIVQRYSGLGERLNKFYEFHQS
ncbi:ATP-dependent DNA helicase, RecD/TraA family [Clostridium aceticum]|uniref:ATP-dependent RecD2 DNA helicase n=1 Tax=Clostridium aceticum TaxID=84022 RepID=A0A0D8I681_9CLOT|nr:ATP-dependent RecD-like DNA helicase [Clostridium aceticum]AKL93765.1 ATP-dependent DNA helicase, RecD/TraA family [Clostridium aceticum]KJF25805.1 ATPase AAA [Clostridium aceticum]